MSLPVILRPAAEADIREAYGTLETARVGWGDRFRDRVQKVLENIEFMPEMYGVVWQDIRAARVRKFRYVVYYFVFTDRVEVLGVIHGSRHEFAWRSRA